MNAASRINENVTLKIVKTASEISITQTKNLLEMSNIEDKIILVGYIVKNKKIYASNRKTM